jgi:o-succinylbenzoate synthase
MIEATYKKHILEFKQASGTSRGILKTKETYFIIIRKDNKIGVGESAVFRGLSFDDVPNYEEKLKWACNNINLNLSQLLKKLIKFPSIQFGLEQAFLSLNSKDKFILFPSEFTQNRDVIPINGLIWMGSKAFMKKQISEKLNAGFTTIKLKIGAIEFQTELNLLKQIRKEFTAKEIALRVDANGAFSANNALEKLKRLADLELHSIEQPIKANQWEKMAELCEKTPLAIALDEELIGITSLDIKRKLLQEIKPQFIILKPSLIGGFQGSNEWINLAKQENINWWITSALESNIGLNAIAQYTYILNNKLPQGLGTGSLFNNNITSPLSVENGNLMYKKEKFWNLEFIN